VSAAHVARARRRAAAGRHAAPLAPLTARPRRACREKLRAEIAALAGARQDQELALALLADNLKQARAWGRAPPACG
jgi:hypothetical protein